MVSRHRSKGKILRLGELRRIEPAIDGPGAAKVRAAGGSEAFETLSGDKLNEVLTYASQYSFRVVAVLPAILLIVFGAIWLYDKARGGYKPEKIGQS